MLKAQAALTLGEMDVVGRCMFESHQSSHDLFRNSCDALDELVGYAQRDRRCVGARLSGGGFGGITIHLVRADDAEDYLADILQWCNSQGAAKRWGAVCRIDAGARVE